MDSLYTGDYHVTFLSRYPADKHFCDDVVRWWVERRDYYFDDTNIPLHDSRILVSPK